MFLRARQIYPGFSPNSRIGKKGARVEVPRGVLHSILPFVLYWDSSSGVDRVLMMTVMTGTGSSSACWAWLSAGWMEKVQVALSLILGLYS